MTMGLQETELTIASMDALVAARREHLTANLEALKSIRPRFGGDTGYVLDLLIDSIEPAQVTPPAPPAPIVFHALDPYQPKARPARRPLYKWEETDPIVCDAAPAPKARKAPKTPKAQELDGIQLGDVVLVTAPGPWRGKSGKVFQVYPDGWVRFMLPDHAVTVSRADVELVNRPEKTECSADCRTCIMARLDKYGRAWCQNGRPYFKDDVLMRYPESSAGKCLNFKARLVLPVNEITGKPIGEFNAYDQNLHAPTDALLPKEDQYAEGRPWLPDFQTAGENSEQARLLDLEESVERDPDAGLSKSWWLWLGRPNWPKEFKIHLGDTVRIIAGQLAGQKGKVVAVHNGPPQQVKVQTATETRTMAREDVQFIARAFRGKQWKISRERIDGYLSRTYGDREARRNAWRKRPA